MLRCRSVRRFFGPTEHRARSTCTSTEACIARLCPPSKTNTCDSSLAQSKALNHHHPLEHTLTPQIKLAQYGAPIHNLSGTGSHRRRPRSPCFRLINTASQAHPKPADQTFTYGTAGLRTRADILDSTCFRVGLLVRCVPKKLKGKTIGLMVTASHNPEHDNGVKMVDPRGEMLEATWEPFCTQIANAASEED